MYVYYRVYTFNQILHAFVFFMYCALMHIYAHISMCIYLPINKNMFVHKLGIIADENKNIFRRVIKSLLDHVHEYCNTVNHDTLLEYKLCTFLFSVPVDFNSKQWNSRNMRREIRVILHFLLITTPTSQHQLQTYNDYNWNQRLGMVDEKGFN